MMKSLLFAIARRVAKGKPPSIQSQLRNLQRNIRKDRLQLEKIGNDYFEQNGRDAHPDYFCLTSYRFVEERLNSRLKRETELQDKIEFTSVPRKPLHDQYRKTIESWINHYVYFEPFDRYKIKYLCKRFKITEPQMDAYLSSQMTLNFHIMRRIAMWCENNMNFVVELVPKTSIKNFPNDEIKTWRS